MIDDERLAPGLYETPLSRRLDDRIHRSALDPTIAEIPAERRPGALSRFVAERLARTLEGLTQSPARQLALVERVFATLEDPDATLVPSARAAAQELVALSDAHSEYAEHPFIPLTESALITNARSEPALARVLDQELGSADRVDLLCAFVKWSGLRLLEDAFTNLRRRGVRFRVLTTTYMGATERGALERLAARYGAQIKINYDTAGTRLHAKSWLIYRNTGFHTAFVGSSNLSRAAMLDGLEWNVRISAATTPALFGKLSQTFESYWARQSFEAYDPARDAERIDRSLSAARGADEDRLTLDTSFLDVEPQPHQRIMLADLDHERSSGRHRNLVVAATGTGKTVLAALDYRRLCSNRPDDLSLLFVAHRAEILKQAQHTYRQVLRIGTFGELLVDGMRPTAGHHVFASVQSLATTDLARVDPHRFDVIVIDEFHHAEAPSYQKILNYFEPRELLGLTATPERADGIDVAQKFFGDRIASELRLWDALEGDLLTPFHYFGVHDNTDLSGITFRAGDYDTRELDEMFIDRDQRSPFILDAIEDRVLDPMHMRALAFCVSVRHAEYMARVLSRSGVRSVALSGHSDRSTRSQALADLAAGHIACICTVDLFNEGLDIPSIDTILMLRPTQSATIFLQQLGRGLRRSHGKNVVTVLDFVGLQNTTFRFERKLRALTGLGRRDLEKAAQQGFPILPPGCDIVLDEVVQDIVLKNLKSQLRTTTRGLAAEVRDYARADAHPRDYSLTKYLVESDRDLSDVLARGKLNTKYVEWTRLQNLAGLRTDIDESDQAEYLRGRVRVFAHVDDPLRQRLYASLSSADGPAYAKLDGLEKVAADMLFYTVWPKREEVGGHRFGSVDEGLAEIRRHPWFADELSEVMAYTAARSRAVFSDPGGRLSGTPLQVHATYRKDELLAAIGIGHDFSDKRTPGQVREGVAFSKRLNVDAFMVQLQKSDGQFSQSTMYADYALTEQLFHWQSQSTTSSHSPTALRYARQVADPSDIALFVRPSDSDDFGKGAPYTFLGLADFVAASGSRPVSVTWELHQPMPQELYLEARAAAS